MINDYSEDINKWMAKINNFCKLNLSNYVIVLDYKTIIIYI